ncbi:MAG: hypothetical protein PUP93_30805 [Rhizonema sp. NSF051]|nr:hypothetical protein [Rhizonema sp. NSF051]
MTYEITTKIARCQIADDIWQSGDDILTELLLAKERFRFVVERSLLQTWCQNQ